ncbi:FAD-dependent monooxygenase [Aquabacter spiritensis]|uniref:Salicylate hydroxylase n=1 Tax=Aquabacter spiritensis TaxID=933073 RepID=A0A4R3LZ44_9HYPH|nr:FAD-dependent monooxygenase [Aquabacter spiritensis]TCT05546.1 salicylate hydroxylase [Aquabacter spiritensis]
MGGGIGGLACAIALRRAGLEVCVLEQAAEFGEIGAGLQLSPNATRILQDLGVLDQVADHAVAPDALEIKDGHSGRLIAACPYRPAAERLGAPFLVAHRADLHHVLAEAARALGCRLELGARLEGVEASEGTAIAVANRHGEALPVEADILIGADGVRSTVRAQLGGSAAPVFAGRIAYRATVTGTAPGAPAVRLYLGPDAHLVTYPMRGGGMTNLVAVARAEDGHADWDMAADAGAAHRAFAHWAPEVRELIAAAEHLTSWSLFDLDPLPRWGAGRATLLGDAAHAMLPFLAQGAAQAIEDAAALAAALRSAPTAQAALRAYEASRRPRTARIQREARTSGAIYHLSGPARIARDAFIGLTGTRLLERYDWLYGARI